MDIFFNQQKYVFDMLIELDINKCELSFISTKKKLILHKDMTNGESIDFIKYRGIVRQLRHVT